MSVQKILTVQNPVLRTSAKKVTQFDKRIERLITDLIDTLKVQKDPIGVGLAAPQIGKSIRLFVAKLGKDIIPFINPEITWKSENTNDPKPTKRFPKSLEAQEPISPEYIMEGCLSLPHFYGPVQRAHQVTVRYQTPKLEIGNWKLEITTKSFSGLAAQIIQHETDHLNGTLFIDNLLHQKRKLYKWEGKEWEEVELP
ncbi:peptide deformylase [Candidatus Microgenomates bacterium]|nr:peptide deformylase [Candidatus Microgenomates bacterium]